MQALSPKPNAHRGSLNLIIAADLPLYLRDVSSGRARSPKVSGFKVLHLRARGLGFRV